MTTEEEKTKLIQKYIYGDCYPMALALSKELGWNIKVLLADVLIERFDSRRVNKWPHPVHACVISPDGRMLDASGFTTEAELLEQYINHTHRKIQNVRFEEYDVDNFLTVLRYLEEGPKHDCLYNRELYSTFDYSHEWDNNEHITNCTKQALLDIEKLDLLSEIYNENITFSL